MKAALPSRSLFVIVVSIACLVASLLFIFVRLTQADHHLRQLGTESQLWLVSQTQYEAMRTAERLARYAADPAAPGAGEDLSHRLVILISRVNTLLDGPQYKYMESIGGGEIINRMRARLAEMDTVIGAGIDRETALRLNGELIEFGSQLRALSNQITLLGQDYKAAARELYLRLMVESLASVLVILASVGFMSFRLFKGMRETQQAKRLLRQEQEFSDLVINLSNQGIVILDEKLRCLLWNPGMEAICGVKSHEVVGREPGVTSPLFNRLNIWATVLQASAGLSGTVEEEFPQDGRERCLEVNCYPLRMSERDLVIVFVRDVTERWQARRRAEQQNVDLENKVKQRTAALRQAEARLVAAIKTAPDGFAAFDSTGKMLIANERIRSLEPIRKSYRDDMSLSTFLACFALCEGADQRLLASDLSFTSIEADLRISKDSWAHLSITRGVEGGTIFVRLTDITPYKKAALALQSALDRERETTSAYRSFVSMVSHQFRTPLAIVDSSVQRLLRRNVDVPRDELVSRIHKIRDATGRLTRLVDSVLNAAKLDAGQIELRPAPTDLVKLVSDVCERHREFNPRITIDFAAPASPVWVNCDGMLIEQVVVNLLSNAIKYSGGASRVDVRIADEGGQARCSVRDWGIGIPSDELARVFDRFFRARTASGIAGTGIGLNVARQIVHMHRGEMQVESREGEGSIFTFTMPVIDAVQAPQAA